MGEPMGGIDFDFPLFRPPRVRILMLTDDDGSYTPEHRFSLSELVNTLRAFSSVYVRFQVTTAHRGLQGAFSKFAEHADIKMFRFDNPTHFDPARYDEVWLFGVGSQSNGSPNDTGESYPVSDAEARILFEFMNAGGGVFATGDHEDLGIELCGKIPRVRSMRKWHFDHNKYQLGNPQSYFNFDESGGDAPPVMGPWRHDTLVAGHDTSFQFDDQSDDIPQQILPKVYKWGIGHIVEFRTPHPILCGPKGVITVLPDHMHEGECVEPSDLTQTVTLNGLSKPEYPVGSSGIQPRPEVIAWGVNSAGHKTRLEKKDFFSGTPGDTTEMFTDFPWPVNAETFGCIGAYDGHGAEVGRVAVDSTFHHFFNINLNAAGSNNTSDPVKSKGFTASAAGLAEYTRIQAYYTNLATWLASTSKQQVMFEAALWAARFDSQLRMSPAFVERTSRTWAGMGLFGSIVREVLNRLAGRCTSAHWLAAAIDPRTKLGKIYILLTLPDPPPNYLSWKDTMMSEDEIITVTAGSIMLELMNAAPSRAVESPEALLKRTQQMVAIGTRNAVRVAVEQIESRAHAALRAAKALRIRDEELGAHT